MKMERVGDRVHEEIKVEWGRVKGEGDEYVEG